MTLQKPWAGIFLAQAADMAFGAFRLSSAAILRLEDAENELSDLSFLLTAEAVDLPALLEDIATFSDNLLSIADAYGHAEARARSQRSR